MLHNVIVSNETVLVFIFDIILQKIEKIDYQIDRSNKRECFQIK